MEKAEKNIHGSSPAYSLGGKHKERKMDDTPGNVDIEDKEIFKAFKTSYTLR